MTKEKIPFERALFYLLILPLIPLCACFFDYFFKAREIESVKNCLLSVEQLKVTKERKQMQNKAVRAFYANAESAFLKERLSSLKFLKKEREATEVLKKKIALPTNESFEKRYDFLSKGENALKFVGSDYALQEGIQETLFTAAAPVEIDSEDLKLILSTIENHTEKKPQLIITDFHLQKKTTANQTEVYELQLQLLQREFTE